MPLVKKNDEDNKEKVDEKEVVSAYSKEGKRRNKNNSRNSFRFTPGFKVLLFLSYAIGLILALGIIFLLEKC